MAKRRFERGASPRKIWPFGKKMTPRRRIIYFQIDPEESSRAFVFAKQGGKLIWSGMVNTFEAKLFSPEDYDKLIDGDPIGRTLAKELSDLTSRKGRR